jgi:hypothetical protein
MQNSSAMASKQQYRRKKPARMGSVKQLAPLTASLAFTKKFRFIASGSATDVGISPTCIRQLFGMTAGGADTSYYPWIDAFRISSVTMTAIGAVGTPVTVALEWTGTANTRSVRSEDVSMGIQSARLSSSPPANSQASFWQAADSATSLFTMSGPTGTVVDLVLQLVLYDDVLPMVVLTTAGGILYFSVKNLDAVLGTSTGLFVPVGYKHVLTH